MKTKNVIAGVIFSGAALALAGRGETEATPIDTRVSSPVQVGKNIELYTVNDERFTCHVAVNSSHYTSAGIDCELTEEGKTAIFEKEIIKIDTGIELRIIPTENGPSFVAINSSYYRAPSVSSPGL